MATNPRQETARIYQFPLDRMKAPAPVVSAEKTRVPAWSDAPIVSSDFGSGWYHEAAMHDQEPNRKH